VLDSVDSLLHLNQIKSSSPEGGGPLADQLSNQRIATQFRGSVLCFIETPGSILVSVPPAEKRGYHAGQKEHEP
jgi:hypothetical protein